MSKAILDASALLALVNQEPGAENVANFLQDSIMSAVNVAEVLTMLKGIGLDIAEAQVLIKELVSKIIVFDLEQAALTAGLREKTRDKGLSLGDRACLALGSLYKCPVITADKIWKDLQLDVKIICIR